MALTSFSHCGQLLGCGSTLRARRLLSNTDYGLLAIGNIRISSEPMIPISVPMAQNEWTPGNMQVKHILQCTAHIMILCK
jgi:hypothetical protein